MSEIRSTFETALLFTVVLVAAYLSIHVGAVFTPTGTEYSWNVVELVGQFFDGARVPGAAVPILIVVVAAVVTAAIGVGRLGRIRREERQTVQRMAPPSEYKALLEKARLEQTRNDLHEDEPDIGPGLPIGSVATRGRHRVFQSWEDAGVHLHGTRRGKTTSEVVPHCAVAPGGVMVTSNKPDGIREILAARHGAGECYVLDPNQVVRRSSTPDFTFDLLADIRTDDDAYELAEIFEASTRKASDRGGDAQFDESGRKMLAGCFLAAALEKRQLRDVYEWLTREKVTTVADILRKHDVVGLAATLDGFAEWTEKTRSGMYATAQRMAGALSNEAMMAWSVPTTGIRQFDPATLAQGTDTLVLLSKKGGSAAAFVTALVRAVCKAAEEQAHANGGRLRVPLAVELDECANVVKWPELPEVYSYYGSLGIVLNAYFQSPAQAIAAYGKEGWEAIWSAAPIRVFGGGVVDQPRLQELSALIGEYEEVIDSTTGATRFRPILTAGALGSLRKWRAVVFASGVDPILIRTKPWFRNLRLRRRINGGKKALIV